MGGIGPKQTQDSLAKGRWLHLLVRRIRVAYALTSMSKSAWQTQWIARFLCRMSGLGPNGLFFVVKGSVGKLFPFRCGSVYSRHSAFSIGRHDDPALAYDLTALFVDHIQGLIIYLRV